MALNSYSNLKTAIKEWLDRGDELDAYLDDFIALAEERHRREIRMRTMLKRAPLVVNKRYINIPLRMLSARTIRILTDPVTVLQPTTLDGMNRRRVTTTQIPKWFTVHESIEFDSTPDSSYTGEIIYYESVSPLGTSVSSNTILDKAPGCYLYGALVSASPLLLHDERIETWDGLYQLSKDNANDIARDAEQIGAPIIRVPQVVP